MAETTKNFELKCPSKTDYYNVEDQNENLRKIDEAIAGCINTGVYTGDGESERFISLPRTPKFVLILRRGSAIRYGNYTVGGLAISGHNAHAADEYIIIEEGGFRLCNADAQNIIVNTSGMEYFYLWG